MTGRRTEKAKREETDRRFDELKRQLRHRHAGVEPDASFADRVVARLERDRVWPIAWAALRLLPLSAALVLALLIVALSSGFLKSSQTPTLTAEAQSDVDPLSWVMGNGEETR